MKREDLLSRIKHEALRLESSSLSAPVRADDLLKHDGGEFVDILYRRVLKREPDAAGKAHYINLLKTLPKPLIIYFVSRSEEAKQKESKVTGIYSALARFCLKIPRALMRALFMAVMKRSVSLVNPTPQKAEEEGKVDYLRFYVDFEEKFRGSEEEVEQGLRVYLSFLEGTHDIVVDLGSGRGEWLRLLKREGFDAKGVDINPYFAERCKAEGLEVIKSDVFEFLKGAESSTIGAIIAFHLIEHLDPRQRLQFLGDIFRALKPGGVLLLETPNPRNILVSAGDFWRDPEHIAPVFPDALSFMTEFVGFSEVECYFFHEDRTTLIPCSGVDFRDLKDYIEVSRDFALFARKW